MVIQHDRMVIPNVEVRFFTVPEKFAETETDADCQSCYLFSC